MSDPTSGLVSSRRGVRVDTEIGWSAVVAMDAEDCERLAASFTAMAARLRERPDIVAEWDRLGDLDTGDARHDDIPEAMVRADEREQLAEAGRLLPPGTTTVEQFAALCTLDGEMVSPYPEPTTLPGAKVLVKGNNVQRAADPDWRVDCTVVRRQQYTTPWEPVDATCGKPGEYWPTGSLRIDLEPCDRQPGHTGRCNWKLPEGLPADIPPPSEETL